MKNKRINPSFMVAYIVILFAILNGPLRLNASGMASLYRLAGPFIGFYFIIKCIKKYKKDLLYISLMLIYNFFISLVFYGHIEFQEVVIVIYVFILYAIIKYLRIKDKDFNYHFLKFINIICFTTILLAWLQKVVPYSVPYIENAIIRRRAVNVYFSNENELGSALACISLINVFQLFYLGQKKWRVIILFDIISSIAIMYLNDAKLSLLGTIVGILIITIYRFRKPKKKKQTVEKKRLFKDRQFFVIIASMAVIGIILLFLINPSINTRDYTITIREMLFDNIIAIITGKEIAGMGTYHDRSTAILYGIKEWRKTFFFGIGLGNSWTMLQMPQYVLRSAKSMHNIIAQFLVELGYFAVLTFIYIIRRVIKMFGRVSNSPIALMKAAYLLSFIFISSQSSSGILSNYLTITATIYVFLLDETNSIICKAPNLQVEGMKK